MLVYHFYHEEDDDDHHHYDEYDYSAKNPGWKGKRGLCSRWIILVFFCLEGYDVSKCDTATDAVPLHECREAQGDESLPEYGSQFMSIQGFLMNKNIMVGKVYNSGGQSKLG